MQENPSQRSDRLLLALAIALQIALMAVVYWVAFVPRSRSSQPPSKVRLEDYSLSNLITVGTHELELKPVREPLTFDDEKTDGSDHPVILYRLKPPTIHEETILDEIAPVTTPTH